MSPIGHRLRERSQQGLAVFFGRQRKEAESHAVVPTAVATDEIALIEDNVGSANLDDAVDIATAIEAHGPDAPQISAVGRSFLDEGTATYKGS